MNALPVYLETRLFNWIIVFFTLSLALFSFISFDLYGLSVQVVDISFVFALAGVVSLASRAGYAVPKLRFRPVDLPIFFHLALLSLFPILGYLFGIVSIVDYSASLRWALVLGVAALLLGWADFFSRAEVAFARSLLLAGCLNVIYGTAMLLEMLGLLPSAVFPHNNPTIVELLNWKVDHFMRVPALFSGPNQLGWYALSVFILAIGFIYQRSGSRLIWYWVAGLHLYLLFLSTSRTAVIALFVVGFLFFSIFLRDIQFERVSRRLIITVFSLCFFLTSIFAVGNQFEVFRLDGLARAFAVLSGDLGGDGSFQDRLYYWREALDVFYSDFSPLGTMAAPTHFVGVIDSGWLSYFIQGGPILVASFSLVLIFVTFYGFRKFYVEGSYIGLSLSCLAIALAVGQITLSPFHYLPVLFIFIFSLLFTVSEGSKE
ncbi:O-antigen ligase family protein [Thauera sp. 27]|uniref:O-antigen ligase family protein n=1 Tax=Thauera sp. 27 TaxID=305700 RepID=UPI0009FA36D7|nr:O-antigen ligase family protein [Thauera sp. 27]